MKRRVSAEFSSASTRSGDTLLSVMQELIVDSHRIFNLSIPYWSAAFSSQIELSSSMSHSSVYRYRTSCTAVS